MLCITGWIDIVRTTPTHSPSVTLLIIELGHMALHSTDYDCSNHKDLAESSGSRKCMII